MKASSSSLTKTTTPTGTIPTITTTYTATSPASSTTISNLIANNSTSFWAYRVTGYDSFGTTTTTETNQTATAYSWATIPTTSTKLRAGTTTDDLTTNTPQTTDVWFGVSPTIDKPAGDYTATITYTVATGI
jgi:hypothetical protein